jgi:RNA polymerase sigma-70 factor (ECF subfamily)
MLVDTYAPLAGTVVWRVTGDPTCVDDLTQETFLRVFRGLAYFDARSKLSTWIYTIAHRVAVDHVRRTGRRPQEIVVGDDPLPERQASPARDPEASLARDQIDRIVRDELTRLPDKYRLPLVYAAIEALDYATIGAMLNVKPGTVKTLVFRARELLRSRVNAVMRSREA